jgi:hypothetical protein
MRHPYLLLLLFLLSCDEQKTSSNSAGTGTGKSVESISSASEHYYKRYSGTIAGRPVTVQLHVYKGNIQGSYYYTADGQSITLKPWEDPDGSDKTLYLKELPTHAVSPGDSSVTVWTLTLSGNKATGSLRAPFGATEAEINLTEDYSNGSTALQAYRLSDSVALMPEVRNSPKAVASYGYLLPITSKEDFLYNMLKQQVVPAAAPGDDMKNAISSAMASYFATYRRENETLVKTTDADLQSLAFAYSSNVYVYVRFNESNWLVTEVLRTESTGGVHSNYFSSFANIDLQNKAVWTLPDIIADTNALRPLLSDAAISFFRLQPGQGMESRLLVDEVPVTANVFVGAKGLSFVYNPYEIASYADGQVSFYIPYTRVLHLLTPAFRQRMKLSEQAGVALLSILHR